MEVYRELAQTEEHPDAEYVFRNVKKRIPAISFDTVYRTLRLLHEKGVISRVSSTSDRARFDANMRQHHHFVCEQCGAVHDFYSDKFDGLTPPSEVSEFGTAASVQVQVRGVCNQCRRKGKRG